MKYKPIALATAALAVGLAAAPARAELVPLTNVQLSGQGVGASFTTLFLQGAGSSTTESGGVLFNGTTFGDAGSGQSQSRTFTFADLALTNASQLAFIVNLAEPGSEATPSVTTAPSPLLTNANLAGTITLNVYSAAGALLEQHTADALDDAAGDLALDHRRVDHRSAVLADDVAQASHGLAYAAVAGPLGVGPGLPEARHADQYEAWVDARKHLPAAVPFLQRARPEVLDDDV